MPADLIVGGQSELAYFRAVLKQCHPWSDLEALGVRVLSADGDSNIPALVERSRRDGRKTMVLYDRDALSRAHEQATVIHDEAVEPYELTSDFEASFDPEIVQHGLRRLSYESELECLTQARASQDPFHAIVDCAVPIGEPKAFGKVELAQAMGHVSAQTWYVPSEIYSMVVRLGELCEVGAFVNQPRWTGDAPSEARGRLYVSNHVTNNSIGYWDFERQEAGTIPLPETFDARVAICCAGTRFVVRRFERDHRTSLPISTWVHVFDQQDATLIRSERFRIRGSVYEFRADEDGRHLELCIQDERNDEKRALRCLADGTQQ